MRTIALVCLLLVASSTHAETRRPQLVVFVSIDQLRGDMLPRYAARFGNGGFRLLLEEGTHYRNAHYKHATTFTGSGHATLFTGANPNGHGITGNDWFDPKRNARVYCVEDDRHTVLGKSRRPHVGTSPRNLLGSTIGDELILASGGRAKVITASVKDRGAILAAGHHGKAHWYDSSSGTFTSSTYYYDEALPTWAVAFNANKPIDAFAGKTWELSRDPQEYWFADARDCELPVYGLEQTFPHPLPKEPGKALYSAARYTPIADRVTVEFALAALHGEQLGQRGVTDMLAVSLSDTDYIGHAFGPNSREAEENMLQLDRTIAHLLRELDRTIGLQNVLILLSSDHGVDTAPECRATTNARTPAVLPQPQDVTAMFDEDVYGPLGRALLSGRHFPTTFVEILNRRLAQRFDVQRPLVTAFWNPSVYLDYAAVAEAGLDRDVVERALAEEVRNIPGFANAIAYCDLAGGNVPNTPLMRKLLASFHPLRSGSVFLVQQPHWYLYASARGNAAMHGSPYAYDTHVPVLLAGWKIPSRTVHRLVHPESMAGTLAYLLNLPLPPNASPDLLREVIE